MLEAGEALTDVGELAAAEAALDAARSGAALLGNDAIGRSAELAGLQLRYTTDATSVRDAVVARARELLPVLEEAADHRGLARAWRLLTYAYWTASRFGMAAEAAEQTIRHAEQAGDDLLARRSVGMLAPSVLYGPTPAGEAIADREEVLSRAAEDRKASAITEVALAHLEAMRGNFEVARVRYRRSRAVLEEFGYRFFAALTSLDSALIEMLAGDLKAAERELRKDYRTLERITGNAITSPRPRGCWQRFCTARVATRKPPNLPASARKSLLRTTWLRNSSGDACRRNCSPKTASTSGRARSSPRRSS